MNRLKQCGAALIAVLAFASSSPAEAVDYSFSGFGTLGYARSNQDYTYQRFIDDGGTLRRDSVLGAQLDLSFSPYFGATVQARLAPADDSDSSYDPTLSWAFVSWRPTSDWLVRVGKLRAPLYLYSENLDVGATFEFARLPTEMYSLSPTSDFTGLSVGKTWSLAAGEASLDGYWGKTKSHYRLYLRDDLPPVQSHGPLFVPTEIEAYGLAFTLRRHADTYRIGIHRGEASPDGVPLVDGFPFVPLGPGIGYYQTSDQLPGPGVRNASSISATVLTLGADVRLPARFRVIGELARRSVSGSEVAPAALGGYLSVLRSFGAWTPYVTYAQLKSTSESRRTYNAVNGNAVPGFIPGATQINASQRAGADGISAYDQNSWALGVSYAPTVRSRVKAEFQRVRTRQMSSLVDAPAGGESGNRTINVLSLSYSFVF